MFYGLDFIYNGIPSDNFGLKVVNFDSGQMDDMTAVSYDIEEQKVRRRPVPYFFGVEQNEKLKFTLTIAREEILDRYDKSVINKWLFNKQYNDLKIIQPDLNGVVYRCILTNPQQTQFGNLAYALKFDVICDAPYGYTEEITNTYSITGTQTISHYSPSANRDYLYPKLIITLGSTTTSFSITNTTDNNRIFSFSGVGASQTITVNNDLGIITATGNASMSNFNKKWFRLLPEYNSLSISGSATVQIIAKYPIIS